MMPRSIEWTTGADTVVTGATAAERHGDAQHRAPIVPPGSASLALRSATAHTLSPSSLFDSSVIHHFAPTVPTPAVAIPEVADVVAASAKSWAPRYGFVLFCVRVLRCVAFRCCCCCSHHFDSSVLTDCFSLPIFMLYCLDVEWQLGLGRTCATIACSTHHMAVASYG
jgi:hypothetical protein